MWLLKEENIKLKSKTCVCDSCKYEKYKGTIKNKCDKHLKTEGV